MPEATHTHTVVTADTFEQEVTKFPGVVLVDYWAGWCGPCRAMEPRIDALGAKYADDSRVKIAKLDVDANSELAQEQQIMSLPTFRVYVGGEMVGQELGLISPPVLESLLLKGLTKVGPAKA